MAYSPYTAVNAIYGLKGQWDEADRIGDTVAKDNIARKAQTYYKDLKDNGYGHVADELSASNYVQSKSIRDKWASVSDPVTGTFKSGVDNPAYNQSLTAASNKNNEYFDTIKSDHTNVNAKYDDLFDYANQDITETDEYKSAWDNVMPSYNLAAMQGRKNEVASVGASNGGNVDSFAAANAMRQQSAITAKGQALAHQMGLESYGTRVDKVRSILSELGVYNNGVYAAMSDSVNNDLNIANSTSTNEQTAKNNEVARLSEQASVTGYVPKQWQYSNNPYFNADGTLNEVYTSKDFDATGGFTTIINNAKAKLATTTDANERANLQATINYATQAKAYKTLGNPYYAQWAHEVEATTPPRTAEYELTDKQIISAENIAKGDNDLKLTLADKEAATTMALADKEAAAAVEAAKAAADAGAFGEGQMDTLKMMLHSEGAGSGPLKFIDEVLSKAGKVGPGEIRALIEMNTEAYNIDKKEAELICLAYGEDTTWLNDYEDRTGDDQYKGMKKKS